jgi:hypothetical protein
MARKLAKKETGRELHPVLLPDRDEWKMTGANELLRRIDIDRTSTFERQTAYERVCEDSAAERSSGFSFWELFRGKSYSRNVATILSGSLQWRSCILSPFTL